MSEATITFDPTTEEGLGILKGLVLGAPLLSDREDMAAPLTRWWKDTINMLLDNMIVAVRERKEDQLEKNRHHRDFESIQKILTHYQENLALFGDDRTVSMIRELRNIVG